MPRGARKKSVSGIYHAMVRGVNRQTIFEDDEDCEKYIRCLSDCKELSGFSLYAYCLMGNHVHLLLKEGPEPLEQIFRRIGARYVFWYNWKYKRSGHLFQDRFKSEPVENDAALLAVLRYIYQNPVKANLCKQPEAYRWSSYRTLGEVEPLADHGDILALLPVEQLRAFMSEPAAESFLDLRPDDRVIDREALQMLKKACGVDGMSGFQQLPRENQAPYLRKLHKKGCSIRQLARITGISKAIVEKAVGG